MKSRKWFYTLALLFIFLGPILVNAEERYISDTLIVSLRDIPSLRGEVISYLRSGDLLEVLEENEDGFIRVTAIKHKGSSGNGSTQIIIEQDDDGLVIAEEDSREILPDEVESLTLLDRRRYGETGFWIYERSNRRRGDE